MKILHIVDSLEAGGMENGIVNMARALEPQGFEMHVACLVKRGVFAERLPHPERVTVLGKAGGFSLRAVRQLSREISRLRPDVLHSHNLGPLIYTALASLGGWRSRLVQGEHSQLTPEELSPRRLRQRRLLYRACRTVHTVAEPMRAELLTLGFPAKKIQVIPNGVDTTRFAPGGRSSARAILGLPGKALCLGIVGRFGPFKRHAPLIEAFETIAPRVPSAHLVIAGSGGSEEETTRARVAASPHAERIHWLGFQADPTLCYRALDLLVIPSTNEGLSNVALEAMASGVPVLGNSGCGHEQFITPGEDGVIADLSTPTALATFLAALLGQPERLVDFGRKARTKMVEHFSIDSMAAGYAHLYRSVAIRPGPLP
jgi:glycosyltransferase involved in cell wall biosynthesis